MDKYSKYNRHNYRDTPIMLDMLQLWDIHVSLTR